MTALLLTLIGVLTLLVVALAAAVLRLSRRVAQVESAAPEVSSDPTWSSKGPSESQFGSLDAPSRPPDQPEYVITDLGGPEPEVAAVPTVAPTVFADLVLREGVVQAASLFHGLRRALAPASRNRIRFEMRSEVKRSRKQRRADLREARREWEARQRATYVDDEASAA